MTVGAKTAIPLKHAGGWVREVSPPVGCAPDLAIEVGGDLATFPHPKLTDGARTLPGCLACPLGVVLLVGFAAWGLALPVACRAQSGVAQLAFLCGT
jgi:hypothetical protein